MCLGSILLILESILNCIKKILSLVTLKASSEFNDSFRMENHRQWAYE